MPEIKALSPDANDTTNMIRVLFIATICLITLQAEAQTFSDFVIRVNIAQEQRRQFMVDSMLSTVTNYPYSESDSMVWFFYKGPAQEVAVAGDMNSWSDTQSPLQRLSNTDLWYRGERFAPDTRIDYKLVVDGNWILDPRNPYTVSGGFGPNSELRMPGYVPPDEIIRHEGVPHGSIIDTIFSSTALGGDRQVRIYLPAGYDSGTERYPVMLFHDGLDYYTLGSAANVLDNMIHEQRIPPCIGVFVPALDRTQEYAGASIDAFTDFIVHTVMKRIDATYRTRSEPEARAMIGSSNGGNIALYIAMKHPEVFGCSAAQSSNIITSVFDTFRNGPVLPVRLYLDLGIYDIQVLIPMVHSFVPLLQSKGYEVLYREYNEGHSWGSWRAHIDNALVFFFARLLSSTDSPPASQGFDVSPVWPNPASRQVTLPFALARGERLRITLCDALGRELRLLHDGHHPAGAGRMTLRLPSLGAGAYFLRISGESGVRSQRLLLR
ncbi:MAG: T9SS type A sorting domain-containing protein [Bacteroidetes bacterium]|nr:T9SS type A sorting domain-containing protein [Bacteroidota bacterium]